MELSKQVVSLDLSKKLKELGVKQESLFYYVRTNNLSQEYNIVTVSGANFDMSYLISAFTVAELGEFLFEYTKKLPMDDLDCLEKFRNKIIDESNYFELETEANVRAKVFICMIESGLIGELK